MKKINDWVIKTFGLRGSWSWAKKQIFDWVGNEFIINLNNFGELEINGLNEGLCIIPKYGNQIVIKKQI